jgi:CHASE3 domain sensor protein
MNVSRGNVPGDQYLGGLFMYLCRTIRQHLFLTVLLPLLAMAIAYVAALQLPTIYTAQGSIRIGKVDGVQAVSPAGAVSRMNSLSFKQRVAEAMNSAGGRNQPVQFFPGNLTARQETADTVAVSVRAASPRQARDAIAAAVNLVNEEQRRTLGPLEAEIKEQLAASDTTIASLAQTRESLLALAREDSKGASGDPAFAAMLRVWLSDLVSRNEERLAAAKAEQRALSARLGEWRTYPTTLLDEPYTSPGFAVARPVTIAIVAGTVAFLVLLVVAMLRTPKVLRQG